MSIPRGYLRQLILYCRKAGETYTLLDKRRKLNQVDFFFESGLRDFQNIAVMTMLKKQFGTLCAPTGSGKTVMALALIALRRQPALIIVHTRDLAEQWIDMAEAFLGIKRQNIGFIGGGQDHVGDKITVGLVQSLYKHSRRVSRYIGHLVVDECHRIPSRTFTEAVSAFNSKYMLGLTATPWRRDGLGKLIFWYLGDMHFKIEPRQLIEEGYLLAKEVIFRTTEFSPYHDPVKEYSQMLAELTTDDSRNRLIAADVAEQVNSPDRRGVLLVLSDRKQHCSILTTLLKYKYGINAELMTGDLPLTERRNLVEKIKKGLVTVLVATSQLIGEGFDCPRLETLFLTTPVRFSGRLLQYIGRVMRPGAGIEKAKIYDYVDINVPQLLSAAKARKAVYEKDKVVRMNEFS